MQHSRHIKLRIMPIKRQETHCKQRNTRVAQKLLVYDASRHLEDYVLDKRLVNVFYMEARGRIWLAHGLSWPWNSCGI